MLALKNTLNGCFFVSLFNWLIYQQFSPSPIGTQISEFFDQKGRSNFNYKRKFKDNRIDINKSIKSQFNLLRIVDNDLYPANFKYKNQTYLLKIFKKK